MGDLPQWAAQGREMGATTFIGIVGATGANLSLTLPGKVKRRQSLPPGDLFVVVLPPGKRGAAGVYLLNFPAK